jgi:hypothetical protein
MSRSCDAITVMVVFNGASKQNTLRGSGSLDAPVSIHDRGRATQGTCILKTLSLKWNQKIQMDGTCTTYRENIYRSRKRKTDIGKYSFANRAIQLWNQLPADALGTLSCRPSNFRKRIRKVISEVK